MQIAEHIYIEDISEAWRKRGSFAFDRTLLRVRDILQIPKEAIDKLSDGPKSCILKALAETPCYLRAYVFVSIHHNNEIFCQWNQVLRLDCLSHPLLAVLVLVYEQEGHLHILLTTRQLGNSAEGIEDTC